MSIRSDLLQISLLQVAFLGRCSYSLCVPSRNIVRQDQDDSYYHVYVRGISKGVIFNEATDKEYFLYLISRHLSLAPCVTRLGYIYPHFREKVELITFCLMDNHFHLLFYQLESGALSCLMKSVMVAYVSYFNQKYRRRGPLFESRFKASIIDDDIYLLHISRYIHLNPRSWRHFKYSSLHYIGRATEPDWLQTERLLRLHDSRNEYVTFVAEYEGRKIVLEQIKDELANM